MGRTHRSLMLFALALVALMLWTAQVALANTGSVTADKTLSESVIAGDGTAQVTLTLTGQGGVSQNPAQIMLLLDHSNSMGPVLDEVKSGAYALIDAIDAASDGEINDVVWPSQMGLVGFSGSPDMIIGLMGTTYDMESFIASLHPADGTWITAALMTARNYLSYKPHPIIVLFSDGESDVAAYTQFAAELKANGVEIYTVAYGAYAPEVNQQWFQYLKQVATDESHYYEAPTPDVIADAFALIGARIATAAATNVVVTETVTDHFAIGDVTTGTGTAAVSGNVITWTIPTLGTETATLTYAVTHDSAKAGGVEQPSAAAYSDAEGHAVAFPEPTLTVNSPPVVTADQPTVEVDEGATATITGAWSDPDGDEVALTASLGVITPNSDGSWSWTCEATDGLNPAVPQTVTITATDPMGAAATTSFDLVVANVAPTVSAITAPLAPVAVGSLVNCSAGFSDPGTEDTHSAKWDWEGSTSAGTVTEAAGSGSVTGSHAYSVPGIYTVKLTVTDKDGAVGTSTYQYVVVYDPSAGFVTGGGWFSSPAGALVTDPALTGKATFGFVSKYAKGATLPSGSTEFDFHDGNLNLQSRSFQWLVISGARAQYKGVGTINGAGDYGFLLTAIDGQVTGGGGVDRIRIKIWDNASGAIVYDNQMGKSDSGTDATAIGGGSIVIHK